MEADEYDGEEYENQDGDYEPWRMPNNLPDGDGNDPNPDGGGGNDPNPDGDDSDDFIILDPAGQP